VGARVQGEPTLVRSEDIELIDVSCQQIISAAVALIPFLEHDESNRALMGANMQRQAIPSIRPQMPLVSTGTEERVALESGQCLISNEKGIVTEVDSEHITIQLKNGKKKTYPLVTFQRSNKNTCLIQRPLVRPGDKVQEGDLLADGSTSDNGVLALGQNVLVAFLPFFGYNYEDAIVISERVLKKDYFTSVHLEEFTCDVVDTKLGPEMTTRDIPNVSEEKLRSLDEEGIISTGAEVEAGDILVGKIGMKEIKDSSLLLEPSRRGRVIRTKILSRKNSDKLGPGIRERISVEIAGLRKLMVGDKIAGRHGNKGVVSIIVPEEDMPEFRANF